MSDQTIWRRPVRWTWAGAGPRERGAWVRAHLKECRGRDALCDLFNLTEDGCAHILDGDDWRPEYDREHP